ncbi:sensor histidine kinase [Aquabacterium sp. OR-4]|uniref:sensor histidine kinase n=1 Tax=Aquabacterium sp. OR-4 TaxID=2978127 RepID=UPI0028C5797C|nr:ATP-binding protein [Aquabacterium sp. OR-4]MDT7838673.1 ATP-binding protein [Aquabacterium sp. OR-4]
MILARLDSLFMRLLLAQLVLVLCCVMIFGWLVITERNLLQVPQFAEVWAPLYKRALVEPPTRHPGPVMGLPGGYQSHAGPPHGPRLEVTGWPSAKVLREALAARGVVVDQIWVAIPDGRLRLWTHVQTGRADGVWFSGRAPSVLPRWTGRTTVTFGLLLLVVAGVSWLFARRVTGPLHRLRTRMLVHAEAGNASAPPPPAGLNRGAPPELVQMDTAYTQLAQRLQRNERERALLLAGVSHDLRSPLSRIRLAAEMLPETSDNHDGVVAITRNVDHADRLIGSFLEFVRASTLDLDLEDEVDLAATARQVVARFEQPLPVLRLAAPERLALRRAPGLLLDRVIVNLIDNAFKHGRTPVLVEVLADGDDAVIRVIDAGVGLPPGDAENLLQAFARGDASRSVPGFGLGLAIAHQVITRLGGRLSFELGSTGHRVQARLPLQRPPLR